MLHASMMTSSNLDVTRDTEEAILLEVAKVFDKKYVWICFLENVKLKRNLSKIIFNNILITLFMIYNWKHLPQQS